MKHIYNNRFYRLWFLLFIISGSLFLSACKEQSVTGIRFRHKSHLDMNLPCEMCHVMTEKGTRMEMPTHESCITCHDIDTKKPGKDCMKCHLAKDYKVAKSVPAIFVKIEFSHDKHTKAGLDCETCHTKLENSVTIDGSHFPAMETCIKCHQMKKATLACISCHPGWDKDHPPQWHSGNWKKLHGTLSREKNMRCNVCHEQATCVKCHQVEEPDDHNQFWKQRGHALTVSWERKKCMTCHQVDFCLKCHQNTPPSSHTAGWSTTHCITCHLPKKDTNCIVCHQNPQHSATTNVRDALPNEQSLVDIMQANNCLLCHYTQGSGAPTPPHPIKFPCTSCHFFN